MPDDAAADLGTSIAPEALYRRLAAGEALTIVDTRDRDEFEAWHVDGPAARPTQIPHVRFLQAAATDGVEALVEEYGLDGPIVAVCARGEASDHAAGLLRDAGLDAANLDGGMDAWARAYVAADVPHGTPGTVRQYVRPSSGCLAYLVHDGGEALLVDPLRAFADRYLADAAELGVDLVGVVDTHVHADHLSGLRVVAERAGIPAYLPDGATDRRLAFDADLLRDGDGLPVGDETVEAVNVPGHTSEMTALTVGDLLLSGDSLFLESVARPDLEAGAEGAAALAAELHASLHDRLLALPDDTVIAPGHVGPRTAPGAEGAYASRLDDLRGRLDLLALDEAAFVERVCADLPPQPANHERIVEANLGLASVEGAEADELEHGPNNCAVSA